MCKTDEFAPSIVTFDGTIGDRGVEGVIHTHRHRTPSPVGRSVYLDYNSVGRNVTRWASQQRRP